MARYFALIGVLSTVSRYKGRDPRMKVFRPVDAHKVDSLNDDEITALFTSHGKPGWTAVHFREAGSAPVPEGRNWLLAKLAGSSGFWAGDAAAAPAVVPAATAARAPAPAAPAAPRTPGRVIGNNRQGQINVVDSPPLTPTSGRIEPRTPTTGRIVRAQTPGSGRPGALDMGRSAAAAAAAVTTAAATFFLPPHAPVAQADLIRAATAAMSWIEEMRLQSEADAAAAAAAAAAAPTTDTGEADTELGPITADEQLDILKIVARNLTGAYQRLARRDPELYLVQMEGGMYAVSDPAPVKRMKVDKNGKRVREASVTVPLGAAHLNLVRGPDRLPENWNIVHQAAMMDRPEMIKTVMEEVERYFDGHARFGGAENGAPTGARGAAGLQTEEIKQRLIKKYLSTPGFPRPPDALRATESSVAAAAAKIAAAEAEAAELRKLLLQKEHTIASLKHNQGRVDHQVFLTWACL